ncbi:DUF2283 domain-containing protein [Leucobacter sp. NPDC058333]|uniref:DUF2283 domain-containing protein n=1 Tax=Leucobacter sp. NPDC058333 TaxID=3346450 RepID=UPI00365B189B
MTMDFSIDDEVDAGMLRFGGQTGKFSHNETVELANGTINLDISDTGTVLGIEFIGVSALLEADALRNLRTIT